MEKTCCPVCHRPGIGEWAKRWSHRAYPARCEHCGRWSHVLQSDASGIAMGTLLILVLAGIVAAGIGSYLAAASGALLALAFNLAAWKRATLCPIPAQDVRTAREAGWLLTVVGIAWALLGG